MGYRILEQGIDTHNSPFVLIKDNGIGMSITNNAERVVEELLNRNDAYNITNKRLFYIDTDNQCDELIHDNTEFTGFAFGNAIGL